jgi:hypothetical protein
MIDQVDEQLSSIRAVLVEKTSGLQIRISESPLASPATSPSSSALREREKSFTWQQQCEAQRITESLYLTNLFGARKKAHLLACGVTHIIVCGSELDIKFPEEFKYLKLLMLDSPSQSLQGVFGEGLEFAISAIKAGGVVLVHWYNLLLGEQYVVVVTGC